MGISDQQLYQLLQQQEFLPPAQLKQFFEQAQVEQRSFYELLLDKDVVSDENLGTLVADFYKLPFTQLKNETIPPTVLKIIPASIAQLYQVIAFQVDAKGLHVATADPQNRRLFELLSAKTALPVQLTYTTQRSITEALTLYKKQLQSTFNELLHPETNALGKTFSKDLPITEIVQKLIEYAYDNHSSDIHIEPEDNDSLIRFRIDGILHDILRVPRALHDQLITRIKVESRLRTDEHFAAQDGKMQSKLPQEEVDIRVSIVPIVNGEKCVMRLLTSHFRQYGLSDLGMNAADMEKVKRGFNKPYGMVLSTGPTGSGKSTTMYAILKILNVREVNIATIEDPVEYQIDGVNQIQVNPQTHLTFSEGLRSILRQDPNVIYVGEIRDNDTADIAINSALTGHLVLSTLHTNDAATSIPRFAEMNIEPFLIASSVNVVIAQRLVRKICDNCKISYTQPVTELEPLISKELITKHLTKEKEARLYKGKGCDLCHNTGYRGRIGIFEVLETSLTIQKMIENRVDSAQIQEQAVKEGMSTMLEDGLDKVEQGLTTLEEIIRETKT
jgi:type IV pilus assembly protein PilB